MGFLSRLNRSADLAIGMAERRGVNLSERIIANPEIGAEKFRSILLRCTGCPEPDKCAELQAGCTRLDAAPEYCRNKALFDRITS